MPLVETVSNGCTTTIKLNTDVFHRMEKAIKDYGLCMQDFVQAARILEKQIPDVQCKNDDYGNDYFQCPDCGKNIHIDTLTAIVKIAAKE